MYVYKDDLTYKFLPSNTSFELIWRPMEKSPTEPLRCPFSTTFGSDKVSVSLDLSGVEKSSLPGSTVFHRDRTSVREVYSGNSVLRLFLFDGFLRAVELESGEGETALVNFFSGGELHLPAPLEDVASVLGAPVEVKRIVYP